MSGHHNGDEPPWVAATHRAILEAGIEVVGHVPDGGLAELIVRLHADPSFTTVALSSEEEGIAMCAGAWLGGRRAAVLMQSSGVGNCTNMLSLLSACQIPALLLVTMRGQSNEANPWQRPMGEAAAATLELMDVGATFAGSSDAVAPLVTRTCVDAFSPGGTAGAVLIEQDVIGAKHFAGDLQ